MPLISRQPSRHYHPHYEHSQILDMHLLRSSISLFFPSFSRSSHIPPSSQLVDSSWNVMARTGGEVKGKLMNAVGSQYPSHYLGTWCIQHYYRWCAHLGCQQSTELTHTGRFKWTRPFRRKTKSGFCACAITFQLACTEILPLAGEFCPSQAIFPVILMPFRILPTPIHHPLLAFFACPVL